jgi:hypothetical protein
LPRHRQRILRVASEKERLRAAHDARTLPGVEDVSNGAREREFVLRAVL